MRDGVQPGEDKVVHRRMLPVTVGHSGGDSTDGHSSHPEPPPGDVLDSNLDFPWNRQEEILAAEMDSHGLECVM